MKMKTRKSIKKRIITKKTGKVLKRKAGQSHFNAREKGKTKRNKRRSPQIKTRKTIKNIKRLILNC